MEGDVALEVVSENAGESGIENYCANGTDGVLEYVVENIPEWKLDSKLNKDLIHPLVIQCLIPQPKIFSKRLNRDLWFCSWKWLNGMVLSRESFDE